MVTFKNSYDPPKQVYGYAPVPPDTGEIVYTFYLVNYFPQYADTRQVRGRKSN